MGGHCSVSKVFLVWKWGWDIMSVESWNWCGNFDTIIMLIMSLLFRSHTHQHIFLSLWTHSGLYCRQFQRWPLLSLMPLESSQTHSTQLLLCPLLMYLGSHSGQPRNESLWVFQQLIFPSSDDTITILYFSTCWNKVHDYILTLGNKIENRKSPIPSVLIHHWKLMSTSDSAQSLIDAAWTWLRPPGICHQNWLLWKIQHFSRLQD